MCTSINHLNATLMKVSTSTKYKVAGNIEDLTFTDEVTEYTAKDLIVTQSTSVLNGF